MQQRKSYRQFCALSRALDHIGDRWTLLVVRELLMGPKTFRRLQGSLPGISPNLLVERLRSLTDDGLVVRSDGPARSKSVVYGLTDAGLALESAVFELIRWGARWMVDGPGDDHVEAGWAALALRALLETSHGPAPRGQRGVVHVNADGVWLTVRFFSGGRTVRPGRVGTPDATVSSTFPALLAAASGWADARLIAGIVEGDPNIAATALAP